MPAASLELPPRGLITLFRRPLILDGNGLSLGAKQIAWDDVEFYTYRWEDGYIAGTIYVVSRDDAWIRIDNRYYYWREAADRVFAELHPRLRADPDYHPFRLTDTALHHVAFGALPLIDIERVEIAHVGEGPGIAVIARGSAADWSTDPLEAVHDLVLLLEELIARGVAVRASVPLWLPPSVSQIANGFSAEVTLPRAEIVRR
ncbi:MAG TPA: hypothetical protein VFT22_07805 [Kofleriaceae bacterium]|nr:hypothetical protein [Kofleriaceae bacterium]